MRVQIVYILRDALGNTDRSNSPTGEYFTTIHNILAREYGLLDFPLAERHGHMAAVLSFVLNEERVDRVLDVVEVALRIASEVANDYRHSNFSNASLSAEDAIDELNARFQEHAIGFRLDAGQIVRVDSEYVHSEVVKPALGLLQGTGYKGAEEEFLLAHEHHRNGRYKEALNDCLKALESTLKTICARRGWNYPENATAKRLIDLVFQEGLIPGFLQSEFSALRATLETGVPTTRNKMSGHGQGAAPLAVPAHISAYALHLTAAAIVLLVEAEKARSTT